MSDKKPKQLSKDKGVIQATNKVEQYEAKQQKHLKKRLDLKDK